MGVLSWTSGSLNMAPAPPIHHRRGTALQMDHAALRCGGPPEQTFGAPRRDPKMERPRGPIATPHTQACVRGTGPAHFVTVFHLICRVGPVVSSERRGVTAGQLLMS